MKRVGNIFRAIILGLLTAFLVITNTIEANASEAESAVIVVENYSLGNNALEAGKEVEIAFALKNTSPTAAASSVIMTVSDTSGMLNPRYGSGNQIYVGNIGPGAIKNVNVLVAVNSKFKADYADITCKLDYVSLGSQRTNSVTVVIPASGGSVITVSGVNVSARATVNGKSLVSVNYANNSVADVNDAELIIDGNVSGDSKRISLGVLEAGKSYSKDLYVVFTEVGTQQVDIKLAYTEQGGNREELSLGTYNVNVTDSVIMNNNTGSVDSSIIWGGRAVALLAVLIAVMIIVIYLKKR